jgi:hypothetical protein
MARRQATPPKPLPRWPWEPRTTTRLGLSLAAASAALGVLFAVLQVQGWKVPRPVGIAAVVLSTFAICCAFAWFAYEIGRALRRLHKHWITTPTRIPTEPPGFFDLEVEGVDAMKRFSEELTKLTKRNQRLTKRITRSTKFIEWAAILPARSKRWVVNRPGRHMTRYAGYIEDRADLLKTIVEAIHTNVGGHIALFTFTSEADRQAGMRFREVIEGTRAETRGAIDANVGYSAALRSTEQQNPSRIMRTSCKRLADGIDAVVVILRLQERRSGELVRLLDQMLRNP